MAQAQHMGMLPKEAERMHLPLAGGQPYWSVVSSGMGLLPVMHST